MITMRQPLLTRIEVIFMVNGKMNYEAPEAVLLRFLQEDTITASGDWYDPAELEEIED